MRRTMFLALFAALLLLAPAAHAADPTKIIRDCADDGTLQGDYTASELRKARSELPTDIDEYSDCRDVLARAISAKTASTKPSPTASPDSSGGGNPSSDPTSGGGNSPSPETTYTPEEDAALSAPSSEADAKAVAQAAESGDRAVQVDASPRSPGASRLAAEVGRNDLPTAMIGVLALLAATLLAACLPLLRRGRRVDADPSP